MLPLGHIAYTWATLTWLQSRGQAQETDFRGAALASLLPDLVDKPLSLTVLSRSGTSQGPCHTLAAQALLTLATTVLAQLPRDTGPRDTPSARVRPRLLTARKTSIHLHI